MTVQRYLLWIDQISTWVGKAFAWLILVLVTLTTADVIGKKFLGTPVYFAFDLSYYLYSMLILMGGAYALARNQHVKGDVFSRNWPIRVQAGVELILMLVFFFPGIIALVSTGFQFFQESFRILERTQTSAIQLPLYVLKGVVPVAGAFMFLQGIAETLRAAIALRTGTYPPRLMDVEETETLAATKELPKEELL